jgi:hypothetical protein
VKGAFKNSARVNCLLTNKFNELQNEVPELETTSKIATGKALRDKILVTNQSISLKLQRRFWSSTVEMAK